MEEEILVVPSGAPETYCRLCLSESQVEVLLVADIFPQPKQKLIDLIKQYINLRLNSLKDAPSGICTPCRLLIEEFDSFRHRCWNSDFVLTGEDRLQKLVQEAELLSELHKNATDDEVWLGIEGVSDIQQRAQENTLCSDCGLVFEGVLDLRKHARAEHGDYPFSYECVHCSSKFKFRSGYQMHLKSHYNELPYKCADCACGFRLENALKAHQVQYHSNQLQSTDRYKCIYCPRVFVSEEHLTVHVSSLHDPSIAGPPSKKKRKTKKTITASKETSFIATPLSFSEDSSSIATPVPVLENSNHILLDAEILEQGGIDTTALLRSTPVADCESPVDMSDNSKPFKCSNCFLRFHFMGSLARHVVDTHNRKVSAAERKQLKAMRKKVETSRSMEISAEHTETPATYTVQTIDDVEAVQVVEPLEEVKPMTDSIYEVTEIPTEAMEDMVQCNQPELYTDFEAAQEADYPIYPCFVLVERLDEHLFPPIPNTEIPLGKYYHSVQRKTQEAHVVDTLDDEMIKNYPRHVGNAHQIFHCPVCLKSFKSRMAVSRHKARHDNYQMFPCGECGREFVDKASLQRHIPIHTNEFPHPCDECPLGFSRAGLLKKHKDRFHGPNAVPLDVHYCPYCPRAFGKLSLLKSHMSVMHCDKRKPSGGNYFERKLVSF